VLILDSQL